MKRILSERLILPRLFTDIITSIVSQFKRFFENIFFLTTGKKFYLGGQFHKSILTWSHYIESLKKESRISSPCQEIVLIVVEREAASAL